MAAKNELKDVVAVLAKIQDNAKAAEKAASQLTKVASEQIIKAIEPDSELIHPWEPDFDGSYLMQRPSGSPITIQHIWDAYVDGELIVFHGPTGCGKSALAHHLLDRANAGIRAKNQQILARNALKLEQNPNMKAEDLEGYIPLPYERAFIACKKETRSKELIGTVDLVYDAQGNKKPVVRWGAVTDAWVNGKTLIMDEGNALTPGVAMELHSFLDDRTKTNTVYINGPQRIRRHDRFRGIITQNGKGGGTDIVQFAGTQRQNSAFTNRVTYAVHVTWLPAASEAKLLTTKTGIDPTSAKYMVLVATKVREQYEQGQCMNVVSTRDLKAWARETMRETKRSGIKPSDSAYWSQVVAPSALPSFLELIDDEATAKMILGFIDTVR